LITTFSNTQNFIAFVVKFVFSPKYTKPFSSF